MKRNGFKIGITIFFVVLCAYYLYPSARAYFMNRQMKAMTPAERAAYEEKNFNSIRNVQDKSLKLGLDLLGGMHVTLEVRIETLIRELATDTDKTFDDVLAAAVRRARTSDVSIIDMFIDEFEKRDRNARLSRYFRAADAGITRRSTNAEVAQYLRTEADDAVNRAIEIIRQRVDRFGVSEPSIVKQGTRRVVVELPGIDDKERVRKLLRGTARLEFRLMAEPDDVRRSLQAVIDHYQTGPNKAATDTSTVAQDSTAAQTLASADTGKTGRDTSANLASTPADTASNRLLAVMQPVGQGVQFGLVAEQDTSAVNKLLADPAVQELLPPGIELEYTATPVATSQDGREMYYLLAVRQQVELTGDVITDARVDFNEVNQPEVTMVMNSEGARDWARITGANVNKPVAIVLDNFIYSYPTVINRILGGRSSITGLESREEAQDIVTILKSGALPAPVDIVAERTVGPSLGAESIRAGFNSTLVGLLVVALFMIWWYKTAGVVANLAVIVNIIFILGIMAGFHATLTLPGIAGIVLTIGMAVDANVLINERIREELATGKTLKAAIDMGYVRAFSAIFDSNITTFFSGAILYSFGVGPIQGFAVTLMAGIIASMFSAIVITRIFFDYMVVDRHMAVNFG